MEVKLLLKTSMKGNLSIDDCFDRVKGLFDKLYTIVYLVQESDVVIHLIKWLCFEYNPYVYAINELMICLLRKLGVNFFNLRICYFNITKLRKIS